ncbi:3-deoxy-D-manno-octulosonic acid transferase, partial [Neisseria gonorrhoeae]
MPKCRPNRSDGICFAGNRKMFQWLYDVLWLLAPIWIRRYLDKRSGS